MVSTPPPLYNISRKKKDDVSGTLFTFNIHYEYTQTNTGTEIFVGDFQ